MNIGKRTSSEDTITPMNYLKSVVDSLTIRTLLILTAAKTNVAVALDSVIPSLGAVERHVFLSPSLSVRHAIQSKLLGASRPPTSDF